MTTDILALLSDGGAWLSLIVATAMGSLCFLVGTVVARRTGVLGQSAPAAETVGVGLGLGLVVVAAAYATFRSGGASTLTPAFLALLVAVALGRRPSRFGRPRYADAARAAGALAFIACVGLVYGSTMAPSARNGMQPMEFMDAAYYAVLSADLHATGLESLYSPAGFDTLQGLPLRSWYHWGELWLGAIPLSVPGITTMQARYLIVLPMLLLAVLLIAGSVVRRLANRDTNEVLFLGAFGMLTIAPIPLYVGDHFDWWARPVGFNITMYGLAYVVVLVGLHLIVSWTPAARSGAASLAAAATASALLAAHLLVAAVSAAGLVVAVLVYVRAAPDRSPQKWFDRHGVTVGLTVVLVAITAIWGLLSGHGLGGSSAIAGISPFDDAWQRATALTVIGAGTLLVGPVVAIVLRRSHPMLLSLTAGAVAAVLTGAALWGLRLADFNSFHIYFGAVAVVLTPIAVAGVVVGIVQARAHGRRAHAGALVALLLVQGGIGAVASIQRLHEFGPGHYPPVPVAAIEFVKDLPRDSKLAYACSNFEEIAVWDARLIGLTAHTDRPVIPMCFVSDLLGPQLGLPPDAARESSFFLQAPQRELYPSLDARPSAAEVRAFLRRHGVTHIYADAAHPNTLVGEASVVLRVGAVTILEVP